MLDVIDSNKYFNIQFNKLSGKILVFYRMCYFVCKDNFFCMKNQSICMRMRIYTYKDKFNDSPGSYISHLASFGI